jgi:BolA protein
MKPTRDALLERFRQAFPEAAIQIEDESHLHVGHAGAEGGAGHFRVYDAVSDWMPARVHALNIIAMTTEEAEHSWTIQQSPSK